MKKDNEDFKILVWTFASFFIMAAIALIVQENFFPKKLDLRIYNHLTLDGGV